MKKIILLSALVNLLIFGNNDLYAQSVGISILGSVADISALLDIDATGMTPQKGVLIPRVALTSTNDNATITTPQTSLLVYNNGSGALIPAGYYYNQGTTVLPNWIPFLTNNASAPAAWSLIGNSGTSPSSALIGSPINNNFIGTTDAKDFVLTSNNLERMRFTSGGNVGIWTDAPLTKLDVNGGACIHAVGATPADGLTILSHATTAYQGGLFFTNSSNFVSGTAGKYAYKFSSAFTGTQASTILRIGLVNASAPNTFLSSELTLLDSNVGIGTISPIARLDVNGAIRTNSQLILNSSSVTCDARIWMDPAVGELIIDQNTTNQPIVFRTNTGSLEKMRIDWNGNVGIGSSTPLNKLYVTDNSPGDFTARIIQNSATGSGLSVTSAGGAGYAAINGASTSTVGTGVIGGTPNNTWGALGYANAWSFYGNGNALTTGTWATSDARWKDSIKTINNPLDIVDKLRGVYFTWNNSFSAKATNQGRQIGLIAQEVEKILPELVKEIDKEGHKAVAYDKLVAVLIEGMKEQQKQIEAQQKTIDSQASEYINFKINMESRISKLESGIQKTLLNTDEAKK